MIGIKSALNGPSKELFEATSDNPEEAAAQFEIWKSRAEFYARNGSQT